MATYRIYQDRNAWAWSGARNGLPFNGTLRDAKIHAESLGWTHVESETGATVYLVAGVWRKA